jgi:hypothetical protein
MKQLIDITIATLTVVMEAQGEPRTGKLAVAYVLANRVKAGRSMTDVILDPWDFSCWNTDSPTRMNIDKVDDAIYAECMRAVLDPTNGAVFYLNKAVVMKAAGKLPDWWDIDGHAASEITIGAHSFRRHK